MLVLKHRDRMDCEGTSQASPEKGRCGFNYSDEAAKFRRTIIPKMLGNAPSMNVHIQDTLDLPKIS